MTDAIRNALADLLQYLDDHDWGLIPEGDTADRARAALSSPSSFDEGIGLETTSEERRQWHKRADDAGRIARDFDKLISRPGFDEGIEAAEKCCTTEAAACLDDIVPGDLVGAGMASARASALTDAAERILSLRSTTAGEQCLWPSCKDVCPPSDMTCTRSMVEPLPETPGLRVRDLPKARSTTAGERELGWRCFHCDEVFITVEAAIEHFGPHELCQAGCQIDLAEYRRMEEVHQQHLTETDEASRTFYAMRADHRQALIREEEKGYTRGVKDAREEATAGERDDRRDGAD